MTSRRHATALRFTARCCTIAMIAGSVPQNVVAQSLASVAAATATAPAVRTSSGEPVSGSVHLLVGRSTVVDVAGPIARVSLSKPDIADALVTGTQQLLVHGKAPGTISLMVWERNGVLRRYEVDVQRDITPLQDQLARLFPGEAIAASVSGRRVVISGSASSAYVVEKAAAVAAGYVEKAEDVVNLLKQQQGVRSNQVLLRVRFAEVSRNALTELGSALFTGSAGYKDYIARSTTQQFAAPDYDTEKGGLVFTDYLNFLLFNTKHQLGAVVRALTNKGLFQTLAEPNLVAENGKEASFLAGGEYPYPVAQSTGSGLAIAIHFKEFGIKLNFTPTILGNDLIHLKVRPEVSSLDFANAVSLEGFRIPALTTRRTETSLELMNGQTFAIAGLLNNNVTSSMQKIPGIGDIPILGLLFRSKAAQRAQTELVVMITPEILRRDAPGAAVGLPSTVEPFMPPPAKVVPPPPAQMPGAPRAPERKNENNEAKASSHEGENEAKASSHDSRATPTTPAPLTVSPVPTPRTPEPGTPEPRNSGTPETSSADDVKKRLDAARKQREAELKAAANAEKDQKAREEEARRAAEQMKKKQDEEAKKAAAIQAKRQKEEDKRAADEARKAAEEQKKNEELARRQQKALQDAETRLKAAEAQYQAIANKKQGS